MDALVNDNAVEPTLAGTASSAGLNDTNGASGWCASLNVGFEAGHERTLVSERRHSGPLRVQRPFYPEGFPCHSYMLHPPGGIVGGDELAINVGVGSGAHALVTTPAANKFYRSAGPWAVQRQYLRVADGASLEWLPQEQIAFEAARADTLTAVDLAPGARFIGWEITCLGRPAAGEGFDQGCLRNRFELRRHGKPLLLERNRIDGGSPVLDAPWGLGGYRAMATLVAVGAAADDRDALREGLAGADSPEAVSLLDDVLVWRWLGPGAQEGLRRLERSWSLLRPRLLGRHPCPPRIWRT
jgi:urease accessory protein